jgi:hypothetical protein
MYTDTIVIPNELLNYILLQRTNLTSALTRKISGYEIPYLYQTVCKIDAAINKKRIKERYIMEMMNDLDIMIKYLPKKCGSWIDIGCGVAGIDLLLYKHYEANVKIYLLDKTQLDATVKYAYRDCSAYYNSLKLAKKFLLSNGIPDSDLHQIDIANFTYFTETVDMVFSLLSWGFHYPISTYSDWVFERLNNGGKLIIDVRNGIDFRSELRKFKNFQIIYEHQKYARVGCEK